MFDSHRSSRDNFENSTSALDSLVEIAEQTPGVYGSRLTGGGFGGSTVSLVSRDLAGQISKSITEQYFQRTGVRSTAMLTFPSKGAVILARGSNEMTNDK
jgi:galactokinase